ncbi:MAG: hypothetical protein GF350_10295 [Chitinivibrionales bacterium]|nr:hypothetical protein [Chitinivibrionales bacterium]
MNTEIVKHDLLPTLLITVAMQAQDTYNVRIGGYGLAGNTVGKYGSDNCGNF